jgi:flagellar hook protein FlgE
MSLYGMMRTGVSGMNAQSTRLGTVADNIANSGTNGYKRASVEFSSLVIPNTGTAYTSGGVATQIRYSITQAGNLQYTTSATDLAINGNGFFTVQDASGQPFLTRAGSFVPDGQGRLVNAAGFYLMGYSYENGIPSTVANGFAGLEPVEISGKELKATATTFGVFSANLPYTADIVTGDTPADNLATSSFTKKTSLTVYDNVGQEVLLDIFFTKTAANTWEMTVFQQPDASATTSFPYGTAGSAPLETITLTFESTTGKLATPANGLLEIDLTAFNGQEIEFDISAMTELATEYTPGEIDRNGNGPAAIDKVVIGNDGNVDAQYANGATAALYRLPLANVASPDRLQVLPGNVFAPGLESGNIQIGFANEGSLGAIVSGAVENSNVDIAEELTGMIESQRNYTANSKVFQTGSDLMDVLVNLKR